MNDPEVARLRAEVTAQQEHITQLEQELADCRKAANALAVSALPGPAAEDPFHAIFESAGIGMGITDMQGKTIATNSALQQMLGYSELEMQGLHFAELALPEDGERDSALFARLQSGELPRYQMEKRYIRRDGSLLHGRLTVSLVHQDQTPAYVLALVEDLSEEKRAMAALEQSEALFHQLADHLDVVFWIFDAKLFRTIYESPAFELVWGRSIASIIANPQFFFDSIFPEDRPHVIASLQKSLSGKQTVAEYRIMRPDGEIRYILDKGFPIYDTDGAVTNIAGLATDVTEARLATERIRRLNESLEERVLERTQALQDALSELGEQGDFFRQIMESMREGIIVYGPTRIIEYANPYVSELTGIPLDEIIGKPDRLGELAANPEYVRGQIQQRPTGEIGDYEAGLRLPNGDIKHIRIMSTPRMHKGQFEGGVAVISDLTQHRLAEENLRRTSESLAAANQELGRAARMKDEFLANVSHELRTPLTGILALSEALASGAYGVLTDPQVRRLQMIEECGRHLLSLINDILDVAKSEAGRMELNLENIQVRDVCLSALRLMQDLATGKRQQMSFTLEPPGLSLLADARRLKQILVNLLGNAVKFTPTGGHLGLRVYADNAAATVTFCVWDHGIGIAPDRLQQIFEPFVQVESDFSRAYSGSGLGLALVQKLASLHGGSVRVESHPNSGSSFYVVLPWHTSSADPGSGKEDRQAALTMVQPMRPVPPLILLAEDNEVTRMAVQDYLLQQGWSVITATDGHEAVRLAALRQPDLILMDVQMAGMNGVQAIEQIRTSDDPLVAFVPIIVLTAHAMVGAKEHFLAAGADDYVSKPFKLADLHNAVAAQLGRARKT